MRIGFDIGGRHISGALINSQGIFLEKKEVFSAKKWLLDDILNIVKKIYQELENEYVINVGIGIPGSVDSKRGYVNFSSNLPFKDIFLADKIKEVINREVKIENDANCAAYGELLFGRAKGYDNALLVTIGTGIGGGIIINKNIYSGNNGFAGEIGHHTIVVGGRRCNCNNLGCFEAYASMRSLEKHAKKMIEKYQGISLLNSNPTGKDIYKFARENDSLAKSLVKHHVFYLAIGIANLITLIQPDLVLIGGGISAEGDFLIKLLKEEIKRNIYGKHSFEIATALLGNNAGIIGAAYL